MSHPFFTVELTEFIADVISHTRMYSTGCSSHGMELQKEMEAKYDPSWMAWLYEHAGKWEEEEHPNAHYWAGYYCNTDSFPYNNPHDAGTPAAKAFDEGWAAADEEATWIQEVD